MGVIETAVSDAARSNVTADLSALIERQRAAFLDDGAPSMMQRKANLDKLAALVRDHKHEIAAAISADFGHRSTHETMLAEVFPTLAAIKYMKRNLGKWMRPERRHTDLLFKPATQWVMYQPLGVVGIISPWNYPFQLAAIPLATALAAGNRVMLKPSELTPRISQLMSEIFAKSFGEDEITVVLGGRETGQAFSGLDFDHMVFTGGTEIGRHVMRAAADNLTPVTLELGGKSPTIIAEDYDLKKAAESIVGGKLVNAGQTCVAPDYVLVPQSKLHDFVAVARDTITRFYPSLAGNPDYTSIINERHFDRLSAYVTEAKEKGTEVMEVNPAAETLDPAARKIAPTLVVDPDESLKIMQEEIFGPLLPIKGYETLDEAIRFVNDRDRPLALYLYSTDRKTIDTVAARTTSGNLSVNESLFHVAQDDIPFGGVGPSGIGAYHGIEGFKALSHAKGVFKQSQINGSGLLRPPYGKLIETGLRLLVGK